MRFLVLALVLLCLFPTLAIAQMQNANLYSIAVPMHDPADPEKILPFAPPVEPNIPQVKYLKHEPSATLQSRVDALLHGIKVDIPPEYDVYGYEIRRYMAHVGNWEIYTSPERLRQEIKNIRKAKIVFKYWQIELANETKSIEAAMEEQKASSQIRTTYKFNKGVVTAFMTECAAWLDANENLLEYLDQVQGTYKFNEGKFVFSTGDDRFAFSGRYGAEQKSREYINSYSPFAIMIY